MTRPDLNYPLGRCVLGVRAATRLATEQPDNRVFWDGRKAFWEEQLAYARKRQGVVK